MKKPSQHKFIRLTAAALSLSLLAAALALVLNGTASPLRDWGETVSRPFLRLFSPVSDALEEAKDWTSGMEALQAENAALEEKNTRLEAAARQGELAQGENKNLRSLLGWTQSRQDLDLTSAQVVGREKDTWDRTLTLDQGRKAGIRAGQYVVEAHGALVGLVETVGRNWCEVLLVTAPDFSLSGMGTISGALGTLEGNLARMEEGELLFTVFSPDFPMSLGEGVVSLPHGEEEPRDILVGTVTSLAEDPGGLTAAGVVTPTAPLDRLSQVYVITGVREEGG
ncbi:MAG: rod shape-determining protein MreC [Ruminiclostridium sp.]|nr:rod shape-determining protein MreC [Ruminiclostridium sp.]